MVFVLVFGRVLVAAVVSRLDGFVFFSFFELLLRGGRGARNTKRGVNRNMRKIRKTQLECADPSTEPIDTAGLAIYRAPYSMEIHTRVR